MNEEWPRFHLPSATAKGEGTLGYGSWIQIKGYRRGLAIIGILPFILLSRASDYLSEAKTQTQLTSAKFKIIAVEIIIHVVSP